ncbi:PBECR4 domain-containing protein [Erysipelothrix aquatica]|uniref:PBECR4 domain-containing protein n=1 Tax=Erysipelothrix aquatica TaxID=2683714 RepID=UPI00135BEB86|nr:PBECR4 domain-containing protein [Erysipelothrix aquatica]
MIEKCVRSYDKMTTNVYRFDLIKKKSRRKLNIVFNDSEFFHLTGLHYLRDIKNSLNGKRSKIFEKLKNGEIDFDIIRNSAYYEDIESRVLLCLNLDKILTGPLEIYSYNKNAAGFSKIKSDYIIKFKYDWKQGYLFIVKRDEYFEICNCLIEDKRDFCQFMSPYGIERRIVKDKSTFDVKFKSYR